MVPRTLFMAADILCSLPFTYWFLLSFTQHVLFLTQRINTPSLRSLFPSPRYNAAKFSSPRHVTLSHLWWTGVYMMLYLLCNALSSRDAAACAVLPWAAQCTVGEPDRDLRAGIRRGMKGKPNHISLNVPAERDVQELSTPAASAGLLTPIDIKLPLKPAKVLRQDR